MTETGAGTQARSVLKITDLVAGYGGGDVLRGVSLDVAQGGITCVVGPNGAGKSTLMAAISGLLRPRLGSIELDGRNLAGMSPRQVLGAASVAFGLLDALLFVSPLIRPELVVSLVVIGIVGIAGVAFMAGFNAILQTSVDDAYRGRVFGAIFATMAVLRLASTVIAGVLGGIVSPIPLLIAMQSGSYVVLGLAALGLLPREAGRERENLLREPA